jgi:hypothetical protein
MVYPAYKLNGFTAFVLFACLFALAQALYPLMPVLAWPFLLLAFFLLGFLLFRGSNDDLFVFLFFSALVRIVIPQNFREVSLFLPLLVGGVLLIKHTWQLKSLPKFVFHSIPLILGLFFITLCFQIFNGMQIPGFGTSSSGNTGFLGRWSQLNNILLFVVLFFSFKTSYLQYLLSKLQQFYLFVLSVAVIMLFFHINSLPLFNSFTWSIVEEGANARKMIIAGFAAVMLISLEMAHGKLNIKTILFSLFLILCIALSGSRTAFLSFFLIAFFGYCIHKSFLLRGMGLLSLISAVGISLLLSPLILYIPAKYQRLVIIFPSSFYSGELYQLKESSAANSSNFRYDMWSKASESIRENPLAGKGIGIPKANYDLKAQGLSAFQKIDSAVLIDDFMAAGSLHNAFISIAYIFGLPAAFFFVLFILLLLIKSYSLVQLCAREHKPYFIFITLLVLNFFIQAFVSDIHNSPEFYAFMAIALKSVLEYDYKRLQTQRLQ